MRIKIDGKPKIEYFESPETMKGFENVKQWLQENCKEVNIKINQFYSSQVERSNKN